MRLGLPVRALGAVALLLLLMPSSMSGVEPDPEIYAVDAELRLGIDRWSRVTFRLEFEERGSRDRIARWGPFEGGFEVLGIHATCDDVAVGVRLVPREQNCLSVRFLEPTRERSRYVVTLEYAFPGTPWLRDRAGVRSLYWRPPVWSLPIRATTLRIALPIELPESIGLEAPVVAEWARRQGVCLLQPDAHAEGCGMGVLMGDAGQPLLGVVARFWNTQPERPAAILLAIPSRLVPEIQSPEGPALFVDDADGEGADAGKIPAGTASDERRTGDLDPRWTWSGGMIVVLAALAWISWRGAGVRRA